MLKNTPLALLGALCVAFVSGLHAGTTSTWNQTLDIGSHFIANKVQSTFSGSCTSSWNGDITQFRVVWSTNSGACWPRFGKGKASGATGYPKLVDSISGYKQLKYAGHWVRRSGPSQTGAYIWLDDTATPSWPFTHEINIWNDTTNNNPTTGTFVGTYTADGANYMVRKFTQTEAGATFTAWLVVRPTDKAGMNLDVKNLLVWLRGKGLPNHYVVEITPVLEGLSSNGTSSGEWYCDNIGVPNL
jgi:hypothetical protein